MFPFAGATKESPKVGRRLFNPPTLVTPNNVMKEVEKSDKSPRGIAKRLSITLEAKVMEFVKHVDDHKLSSISEEDKPKPPAKVILNEDAKPPNILLVGSTGSGKSSFGNWINTFSQESSFKVGETMAPCTQDIAAIIAETPLDAPQKSKEYIRLKLVDTPGLNEESVEKDLNHMSQLLQIVHSLKFISLVVLCVPFDARRDAQTVTTLRYYKHLFQPLFSAGNIVIIITRTNSDNFERVMESGGPTKWKELMECRRREVAEILEMDINEHMIDYVNSVPSGHQLKKFLRKGIGEYGKNDLLMHSAVLRQRLLRLVVQLNPISMENHLFPLPPCMERKREEKLQIIEMSGKRLQQILAKESQVLGELIEVEIYLRNQINAAINEVDMLKGEKLQKSQPQYTAPQLVEGSTWFGGSVSKLRFECPLDAYILKEQHHNCSIISKFNKQKKNVTVKIKPDVFHIREEEVGGNFRTWFARVQAEFSGQVYYSREINTLSYKIIQKQKEVDDLQKQYDDCSLKHRQQDQAIVAHQNKMHNFDEKFSLLLKDRFQLSDIPRFMEQLACEVDL